MLGVREEAQDDVRGTVETALNVGVDNLLLEAAATEVRNDDSTLVFPLEQNVFRLQVTMNDAQVLHVPESGQELDGESSDETVLKSLIIVHLDELIKVDAVEVEYTAEMVPEHEVVSEFHDPLDVIWIVFFE